ncbi:MAG TPA: hypothetical protein VGN88_13530 [Phycisphaerae bacterium]
MDILKRMVLAVELVRRRERRVTEALELAGIPYALSGGNAVALWVRRADAGAERFTQDVDILLRRVDLHRASAALRPAGFVDRETGGVTVFLDGPNGGLRESVKVVMAGEKVREIDIEVAPDVEDVEVMEEKRVLRIESLARWLLVRFKVEDRVLVRDMLEIGLIDGSWKGRFVPELAARLQELIDTPEG